MERHHAAMVRAGTAAPSNPLVRNLFSDFDVEFLIVTADLLFPMLVAIIELLNRKNTLHESREILELCPLIIGGMDWGTLTVTDFSIVDILNLQRFLMFSTKCARQGSVALAMRAATGGTIAYRQESKETDGYRLLQILQLRPETASQSNVAQGRTTAGAYGY
jgi:hypothetical protein